MRFASPKILRCVPFGAAVLAFAAGSGLRYQETFDNPTGKARNIDVADYAWDSYVGEGGVLSRAGTSIGAGPGHPSDSPGYLTVSNAPGVARILVKTFKTGVEIGEGVEAGFRFGASNPRVEARLLVRVGGEWFASDAVFTSQTRLPTGAAFSAASDADVLRRLPIRPEARAWRRLRLAQGKESVVELSGPALSLPAKLLTGAGFHVVNQHGSWGATVCFDTLLITAP